MTNQYLSVVIPVFNDQEVLNELYKRLKPVLDKISNKYEIVFIDDGSKDNSFQRLKSLQEKDKSIKIIKLSRNFGQSNAISAGLDHSEGEIIIIMDSDLQDRPEDIPELINSLNQNNASMSIAKWIYKEDSKLKKFASNIFFKISNKITCIHHSSKLGVFRVIRKEVLDKIKELPQQKGSTLSLMYWAGFDYVTVGLKRGQRYAGKSGYNLKKLLILAFERILSYSLLTSKINKRKKIKPKYAIDEFLCINRRDAKTQG